MPMNSWMSTSSTFMRFRVIFVFAVWPGASFSATRLPPLPSTVAAFTMSGARRRSMYASVRCARTIAARRSEKYGSSSSRDSDR